MKLTYTIQVCNESRELYSLLNFLGKTVDDEDEINVVVDANRSTDRIESVLEHFKERITVFKRPFDSFYLNSQFHADKATGEYAFLIDADEMPQELLIKNLKNIIKESGAEIIAVPRINIDPGYTQAFLERCNYKINEVGWINWPDFQTRIFKKCDHIKWTNEMHTKLSGTDKIVAIQAEPKLAMWHIKSIEKEENRWKDGNIITSNDNLYDKLM
jgi:GT2 family glycosyltransferase